MFDLGWTELLIIGVVALIVVGPKDLPGMFRSLGQFTSKIRRMAREFGRAMEDAADASGVKEAAKDLNSLRSMTSTTGMGKKALGLDDYDPFDDDDTPTPKAGDPALNKTTQAAATQPTVVPAPPPAAAAKPAAAAEGKAPDPKTAETDAT